MVSLGQVALYGIAGFTMANLVEADGGSAIAWNPWVATRGRNPRRHRRRPLPRRDREQELRHLLPDDHARLRGARLLLLRAGDRPVRVRRRQQRRARRRSSATRSRIRRGSSTSRSITSAGVYALLRYISRAPLGLAFQGVRDDPSRMRALGYNVLLLRTVAFGLGAFVAALAGVLSVWWNTRISPGSIALPQTIDVLVIAVIGGLYRLEGAWVGAIGFAALDNWIRGVEAIGSRFNTVVGLIFLAIVLLSPGGLMGIWESLTDRLRRRPDSRAASRSRATTRPRDPGPKEERHALARPHRPRQTPGTSRKGGTMRDREEGRPYRLFDPARRARRSPSPPSPPAAAETTTTRRPATPPPPPTPAPAAAASGEPIKIGIFSNNEGALRALRGPDVGRRDAAAHQPRCDREERRPDRGRRRRHHRRPADRDRVRRLRLDAGQGGRGGPAARRAGEGRHPRRPALGQRGHRRRELLQGAAGSHVRERHLGRAGHDAEGALRRTSSASTTTARSGRPVSATTPTTSSAGGTSSRSATTTTSRTRRSRASWPSSAPSAAT